MTALRKVFKLLCSLKAGEDSDFISGEDANFVFCFFFNCARKREKQSHSVSACVYFVTLHICT